MSFSTLVDGSQDTLVYPESHGGSDEGQRDIADDGQEGEVPEGDQDDEDGTKGNARLDRVPPLHQAVPRVAVQQHGEVLKIK